jgi:hypothetical protein
VSVLASLHGPPDRPVRDAVLRAVLDGRADSTQAPFMARRRSFTSELYRAARFSNNISAIASGNPRRVARRAKNVAVGRALGRGGSGAGSGSAHD